MQKNFSELQNLFQRQFEILSHTAFECQQSSRSTWRPASRRKQEAVKRSGFSGAENFVLIAIFFTEANKNNLHWWRSFVRQKKSRNNSNFEQKMSKRIAKCEEKN